MISLISETTIRSIPASQELNLLRTSCPQHQISEVLIRNLVVASVRKIYMIDGAVLTKVKNLPLILDHPVLQKFFALIQI